MWVAYLILGVPFVHRRPRACWHKRQRRPTPPDLSGTTRRAVVLTSDPPSQEAAMTDSPPTSAT